MIAKTGILLEKGKATMIERELGELKPYEVIIKVEVCNLCTTDYQQWQGLREHQGYPMAGGHETAGTIYKLGASVKGLKVGDQVAVGYSHCGSCINCRKGLTYECINEEPIERTDDGFFGYFGLANYQKVNVNRVVKFEKRVAPEHGAFLEPLGTVIHGIKKLDLKPGDDVVVVGAGTMGLLNALVARIFGANVMVSEIQSKQRDRARIAGIKTIDASKKNPVDEVFRMTNGKGADVVIGAVGLTKAYDQAVQMLKKQNGKFLVFSAGYPVPVLDLDPNTIHYREIQVIGTMGGNIGDFIEAGKYLSSNLIDVSHCLEGVSIGLNEIDIAYQKATQLGTYRITVNTQKNNW